MQIFKKKPNKQGAFVKHNGPDIKSLQKVFLA